MSARTLTLLPIVVVALFLGLLVLIATGGGDDDGRSAAGAGVEDPLAEALTFIPADAPLVGVVETDSSSGPFAALQALGAELPGSVAALTGAGGLLAGVDLRTELLPLLGNPVVIGAATLPREGSSAAPAGLPFRIPSAARLGRGLRVATVAQDPAGLGDLFDRLADSAQVTRDGETRGFDVYTRPDGVSFAVDGPVLVATGSRSDLSRALTLHSRATRGGGATGGDGTGSLTPTSMRERFTGLPGRTASVVRLAVDVEELQASDAADLEVPWVGALRRAAFAVVPGEEAVDVRFRLSTDPETVTDGDVPIATGPATPAPAADESEPLVVAFRDIAHTIEFARRTIRATDPELARELDAIEVNLRRFARVDPTSQLLLRLTGTTTITTGPDGGLRVRAEVKDPEAIADVLGRLRGISSLGSLAGGIGMDVETRGITIEDDGPDTFQVLRDGSPVARVAVLGEALVLSTDVDADLQTLADAFPESPDEDARGAFSARLSVERFVELAGLPDDVRSALSGLDSVAIRARGETEALSGSVRFSADGD